MNAVLKLDELLAPIVTLKGAEAIAGPLGTPSKMPGFAYGISAYKCKVGTALQKVEGSVCSKCYALRGHYVFRAAQVGHARRLAGISHPRWVEAMVWMIRFRKARWFRWHDSGDLQDMQHLLRIIQIAKACPRTKFWLPTREQGLVDRFYSMDGVVPRNLVIRVSATMIDGKAPSGFRHTSTVVREAPLFGIRATCRAKDRDNKCGPCRACWSRKVRNVSYALH